MLGGEKLHMRVLVSDKLVSIFPSLLTSIYMFATYKLGSCMLLLQVNLSCQMLMQVDHSIIESFGQGGRTVITSRIYPTEAIYGAARLFLFNNATGVNVKATLKIWELNSAFIHPFSLD